MPAINPLPTPPSRNDPANFSDRADAFLAALPAYTSEANALLDDVHTSRDVALQVKADLLAVGLADVEVNANAAAASAASALTSKNAAESAQADIHNNWQAKLDLAAASAAAAGSGADIATVQAANAAASASSASASATSASASVTTSSVQADVATAQANAATSAKTAAEAARDATVVGAAPTVYASTTDGLAATTSGKYFSVPSAEAAEYLILYLNNAGVAQEVRRYPSVSALAPLEGSASMLIPGRSVPTGWRNISAKVSGLPVIAKTAMIAPLMDIFANGEKGFAVFANGGPLFTDSAKTDFADASLDPVRVIADASPRNVTVAATTDAKRPLLKFSGTGAPYMEFDGADDAMEVPVAAFGGGAMAFVCSVELRSSTPQYPTVLAPVGGGNAGGVFPGFNYASPRWAISKGSGSFTGAAVLGPAIPLNTRTTLSYIYTGSQLQLYVNGALVGSSVASGNYVATINHALCQTQGLLASPINFFGGVFVDRNVTTTERQYLEGLVASNSAVPNETYLTSTINENTLGTAQDVFTAIQPDIQSMVDAGVKEALLRVGVNYSLAPLITSTKAYSLGDSTVADYTYPGLVDLVSTSRVIVDIATPGDTIAGQKSKWLAQTIDPALVGWVVVQIGLNDMNPTDGTTASKIAELQDLINTIRGEIGSTKKILISKMLPCRQRYIDIYGATNGPLAQQRWVDVNAAIAGEGSTPITGVDARITAHVPLMDDGAGNLKAAYDTGDKIHPNLAGRQLMADEWKKAIWALGLVV